jgi:S-formylglutathione hydrolase FrmB
MTRITAEAEPCSMACSKLITEALRIVVLMAVILRAGPLNADEPPARISPAGTDKNGFAVHAVSSPYQAGPTQIRVFAPDPLDRKQRYPVVYVLPVEARNENRYGDGLAEVKRGGLSNKHRAIFVAPTFSDLPWYADHPSDCRLRQETYLLKVVVPFIDAQYPTQAEPRGRLLLGFSKSGWGAVSLLLRHPDLFGKAAAWDAPLMQAAPNRYEMQDIFGTQENFEKYQISKLLKQRAADLRGNSTITPLSRCGRGAGGEGRLILAGYANFRRHHQRAHELLSSLGIPHAYQDGPQRTHDWHSGWLAGTVELLIAE